MRRRHATGGDQPVERVRRGGERSQHRDGPPVLRDLEPLSSLDAVEVLAEVLPELSDSHLSILHVAHGSTSANPGTDADRNAAKRELGQKTSACL